MQTGNFMPRVAVFLVLCQNGCDFTLDTLQCAVFSRANTSKKGITDMSKRKKIAKANPHQDRGAPEDLLYGTFFDAFADVFTPPEDLSLYQPDHSIPGHIRDARCIREYFRKAVGAEKQKQKNHWTTTG